MRGEYHVIVVFRTCRSAYSETRREEERALREGNGGLIHSHSPFLPSS